jgi:hypothetical protein
MKNKKAANFPRKFGSRRRNYRHYQTKGTKVIFTLTKPFLKLQIPHGICSEDDSKLLLSKQWFNHHFNGEKYYSENGLKDLLEATKC